MTPEMAPELTDDDVAATLGYITTLSEQMMPQEQMMKGGMEEGMGGETEQGMMSGQMPMESTGEMPMEDMSAQLDEIEQKLEQLLEKEGIEENDKETENTESPKENTEGKE